MKLLVSGSKKIVDLLTASKPINACMYRLGLEQGGRGEDGGAGGGGDGCTNEMTYDVQKFPHIYSKNYSTNSLQTLHITTLRAT